MRYRGSPCGKTQGTTSDLPESLADPRATFSMHFQSLHYFVKTNCQLFVRDMAHIHTKTKECHPGHSHQFSKSVKLRKSLGFQDILEFEQVVRYFQLTA